MTMAGRNNNRPTVLPAVLRGSYWHRRYLVNR